MNQPEGTFIFKKWIKAVRLQNRFSKVGDRVSPFFAWLSYSCRLNPESDRPHHVLANAHSHNRFFFVSKDSRVFAETAIGLWKPGITTGKCLMTRKPVTHN